MKDHVSLAPLLQSFFIKHLIQGKKVSPHTIASYRDSFRALLKFAALRLHVRPSQLKFEQITAPLVEAFLYKLETECGNSARTINLRLTAIHSFFDYASPEVPERSEQIDRVLKIPRQRFTKRLVRFLTRDEVDALLNAPDRDTWIGRRDYAFILTAVQTGLRISEMTALSRDDVVLGTGAHLQVLGKGRKERCVPLARNTQVILKAWLRETQHGSEQILFPNRHGDRLTVHGVQYFLAKYRKAATNKCHSLKNKRISVHRLRHTMAIDMLAEGVDLPTIALWLGHEDVKTTLVYLDATLGIKEKALAKLTPRKKMPARYRASDQVMRFLDNL